MTSQQYNPIDVSHAGINSMANPHSGINSMTSANPHSLSSITSLGSVPHSALLPTSLSLASPFQLSNPLLQSPLSLSHHLPHPGNLLHSQLTPPLTPIAHMPLDSSPAKARVKSPKRATKPNCTKSSSSSSSKLTVSATVSISSCKDLKRSTSSKSHRATPTTTLSSVTSSIETPVSSNLVQLNVFPKIEIASEAAEATTPSKLNKSPVSSDNSIPQSVSESLALETKTPSVAVTLAANPISVSTDKIVNSAPPTLSPSTPRSNLSSIEEEKKGFDKKVSNFSSSVDYSMPITTIYLKHMRDYELQKQEEEAMVLEEERRQAEAVELHRLRSDELIRREQQIRAYWQQQLILQQQRAFLEQEHLTRERMAQQMRVLNENNAVSGESVSVKTEPLPHGSSNYILPTYYLVSNYLVS